MSTRDVFGTAGFSLIEILLATLVLTIGLLSLSAFVHGLGSRTRRSDAIIELDLRARSVVESLRSAGYSGTSVGVSVTDGSEIRIWDEGLGIRELNVVVRDSAADALWADTLATRLVGR